MSFKMSSSLNLGAHYDSLCNMVIRPPRCNHYTTDDMGPKSFNIGGMSFVRNDFELINNRGFSIQCSHFKPSEYWTNGKKLPCVIYCHGNSGCRLDSLDCVRALLPINITVLAFDFCGSGLSGGEYVTLGYYEKEDIATVVKHLRETDKISTIGLWGRSMGAVTSILYAKEDPSIAGMVLDSPFSCLSKVAEELVQSTVQKIPKFMISFGLKMIRSSIKKKAQFDIKELDIVPIAEQVFIPSLFAHGKDDSFVKPHHSEKLYEKYQGDKNRLLLEGDHNSDRPHFFFESVCIFFVNTLKPDPIDESKKKTKFVDTVAAMGFYSEYDEEDDVSLEEQQIRQAILLSIQEPNFTNGANHHDEKKESNNTNSNINQTNNIIIIQDIIEPQQQVPQLEFENDDGFNEFITTTTTTTTTSSTTSTISDIVKSPESSIQQHQQDTPTTTTTTTDLL